MPDDPLTRALAIALAVGRLGVGAGIWLAPGRAFAALGLGDSPGGAALVLGRVAATRDLLLGAAALRALDDRARLRETSLALAVADGADALAFAFAAGGRGDEGRAAARGLAAALPATAAGVWLAARLREERIS